MPLPGQGDDCRVQVVTFHVLTSAEGISLTDVWAVGFYGPGKTLIEHWNGTQWSVAASPSPGAGAYLNAVSAASADNVWAVGNWGRDHIGQTLIEHWTGSKWVQVSKPDVAGTNNDSWWAVAASPSTAWVVGSYVNETTFQYQTLAAQLKNGAWSLEPVPDR